MNKFEEGPKHFFTKSGRGKKKSGERKETQSQKKNFFFHCFLRILEQVKNTKILY